MSLVTPDSIRTLQRKLYTKAKQEPAYRFYALYDKLYRADILSHAWQRVKANGGSPGIDGLTFEVIERTEGVERYLSALGRSLQDKTYRADPVRRVMIPKADGSQRPLGIPTIRDRVVQMAWKLVVEPIFEADFCEHAYGFRPQKSAHDAIDTIAQALHQGYTQVIDADLSKYFDSIPHAKLLAVLAERMVDGAMLALVKLGSRPRSSAQATTANPVMKVAAKPIGAARRKAASRHRCYRTVICICSTASGSGTISPNGCKPDW